MTKLTEAILCRECGQVQAADIHHDKWEHDFEGWGAKLEEMTCPQCCKAFLLTWNDYSYDERTRAFNSGKDYATLKISGCPSGGIYAVSIGCPHCDYEEAL